MDGDNLAQISHQIAAISILKAVPSLQLLSWVLEGWFSVLSTWHSPSYGWFGWLIASGGCCQATGLWQPLLATMNLLLASPCFTWAWKQKLLSWPRGDPRVRLRSTSKPAVAWHYSSHQSYLNTNRWLLCSCPKLWPTSGTTVPAGSLADVADPLPGTGGLSVSSGCTPSRCEMWRGWKNKSCCPQK